jgi:hypothetical protein
VSVTSAIVKAIAPLTGGVSRELSAYVGDQIRFMRWKSAVRILNRAKTFCEQEKIKPRDVPIKFIVPFLEAASFEDVESDGTLADMWSALFASAVSSYQARHVVYIDILKKLSSRDAEFITGLRDAIMSEEIYADEGFDPDLWNINDKQDQVEHFAVSFAKNGKAILNAYRTHGLLGPPTERDPFHRLMTGCVCTLVRSDVFPLAYDLGLYQREGWTNGTSSPFKDGIDLDSIFNLVSLGLMEKFDVVAWHPKRHVKGIWAARATASFAILTTLGLDFMKACIPKKSRPSGTTKRKRLRAEWKLMQRG